MSDIEKVFLRNGEGYRYQEYLEFYKKLSKLVDDIRELYKNLRLLEESSKDESSD